LRPFVGAPRKRARTRLRSSRGETAWTAPSVGPFCDSSQGNSLLLYQIELRPHVNGGGDGNRTHTDGHEGRSFRYATRTPLGAHAQSSTMVRDERIELSWVSL